MLKKKKIYFTLVVVLAVLACSFIKLGNFRTSNADLTVIGIADVKDGIGNHATSAVECTQQALKVNYLGRYKNSAGCVSDSTHKILSNPIGKYFSLNRALGKVILYTDTMFTFPKPFKNYHLSKINKDKHIRIAFSVWESNSLPYVFVKKLNENFDAVVVPDPFLVDVYRNSGVKLPILTLELPVQLQDFHELPLKKQKQDIFVFSCLGSYIERKNQLTLVRAFAKAFGNNPHVALVMNGRNSYGGYYEQVTEEIKNLGLRNVKATENRLSREDYVNWFRNIDCYVNVSHGEGYSISPRESLALGIPTILTRTTAQAQMCGLGAVRAVETTEKKLFWRASAAQNHVFDGQQDVCSVDALAEALLDVYQNYEKFLAKSEEAREWTKHLLPENLAASYQNLVKPKKLQLGEENKVSAEGLTLKSEKLFEKYRRVVGSDLADETVEKASKPVVFSQI